MFPTATTEIKRRPELVVGDTGREAIKRDFNDLDSLIGELSVPKEQINRASINSATDTHSYDNQGQPVTELVEAERMAPEIAAISGKAIAGTIDTLLSTGLSLYAKAKSPEKFEASDKQMQKLSEAWAHIAAKYNYRAEDSAWLHVIALNLGIYTPKFNEAKNDRRFAEMQERFEAEKAAREALEKRVENIETKNQTATKPAA